MLLGPGGDHIQMLFGYFKCIVLIASCEGLSAGGICLQLKNMQDLQKLTSRHTVEFVQN